jgi:hypothetical protein
MLRPIPTVHPLIMCGSLMVLAGLLYGNLHSPFREPEMWISNALVVIDAIACGSSLTKRTRAINEKYSRNKLGRN